MCDFTTVYLAIPVNGHFSYFLTTPCSFFFFLFLTNHSSESVLDTYFF